MHSLRLSLCLPSLASLRAIATSSCLVGAIACDPGSDADDDGGETDGNGETDAGDDDDDDSSDASDAPGDDDDSGVDTSGGDTNDPTGDTEGGGTPVGDDVFFYVREVDDNADELWAYDVATDTAQRAFAFDGYAEITSLSIHPDRSVLAVASDYDAVDFQQSESIYAFALNETLELDPPALLMEGLPKPLGVSMGYSQQIDDLRWHPDGSVLWLGHSFNFDISEPGGGTIASLDAGGELTLHDEWIGSCTVNSGPSPSPDGSVLLAVRGVCTEDADAGLVGFDVPLAAAPQVIVPSSTMGFMTPRWLPDGTGIVYVDEIDYDADGDGTGDIFGIAVVLLDVATGMQYVLLPPTEGEYIWDFTMAPDGARLVVCYSHDGAQDLLLADFSTDVPTTRWLTDDGVSCKPTW